MERDPAGGTLMLRRGLNRAGNDALFKRMQTGRLHSLNLNWLCLIIMLCLIQQNEWKRISLSWTPGSGPLQCQILPSHFKQQRFQAKNPCHFYKPWNTYVALPRLTGFKSKHLVLAMTAYSLVHECPSLFQVLSMHVRNNRVEHLYKQEGLQSQMAARTRHSPP